MSQRMFVERALAQGKERVLTFSSPLSDASKTVSSAISGSRIKRGVGGQDLVSLKSRLSLSRLVFGLRGVADERPRDLCEEEQEEEEEA